MKESQQTKKCINRKKYTNHFGKQQQREQQQTCFKLFFFFLPTLVSLAHIHKEFKAKPC